MRLQKCETDVQYLWGISPSRFLPKMYVLLLFMQIFLKTIILQPLKKQLQRHILSFVPTAKVESIRFRSIPFQVPTTKLSDSGEEGDSQTSKKEARTHVKQRTSNWRANQAAKEEDMKSDEKTYLTHAQTKKIAFINQ